MVHGCSGNDPEIFISLLMKKHCMLIITLLLQISNTLQ
jgi:hypothetical protein